MRIRHPRRRVACLGACIMAGAGCSGSPPDQPLQLPGVDPAVVARISAPDAPSFAAFLETASTDRLIELRQPLLAARHAGPHPSRPGQERLTAILAGVDRSLADGRGLPTYAEESAYLEGLSDSTAAAVIALRQEAAAIFGSAGRQTGEKIERLRSVQRALLAAGDVYGAGPIWGDLAVLEHRRGGFAAAEALQRQRYEKARALARLPEACRAWGQLAMADLDAGLSPTQRDTLLQLTAQARAAGLAAATSNLLCMQAYDAFLSGRTAASRTAFEEGIEICRELGEPAAAVPTMVLLMRLYATLECWDQVASLLARASGLLDEATGGREPSVQERLQRTQLENLAACRLASLGRSDPAHAVFRGTFAAAQALPYPEAGYVGRQWFEAMMEAGRLDLATEALAEIEPHALSDDLPQLEPRLPFWLAWLSWRRGDRADAERHLERFKTEGLTRSLRSLEHHYRALRARVAWDRDPDAAAAMLLDGWRGLHDWLLAHEAGSETYLDLNRNPHLRWAAQDLLADDPRLGYGLELLWRDAMLRRSPALSGLTSLSQGALARAEAASGRLAAGDAVHCVFGLRPEGVVRWSANGAGVERTTLTVATEALHARIAALLAELAEDPGDPDAPVPAALAGELGALARLLLPERFFAAETRPARLYVSGESFLTCLPFAALNVGRPGAYEPLAASVDLAWVRHGPGGRSVEAGERILVVADPALDPGTRRRFCLPSGLAGAREELASIRGALPGVEVLAGGAATRARVFAAWGQVDVLYFAGHAITDPLVPFYAWIPLSSEIPPSGHPGIDIKDVLSHSFGRHPAVFLSGCATGAPYFAGLTSAPSLGDAFLDAGAAAAVQTLWSVRDLDASVQPDRMLLAWRQGDVDLVSSVSRELRRALPGPRGVRHPFSWAAWTVNVRAL